MGLKPSTRSPRDPSCSIQVPIGVDAGGLSHLRRLLYLELPHYTLRKQTSERKKESRWFVSKENTGTDLFLSKFSQEHSWILCVRRLGELSVSAANSENNAIFWNVVGRGTASPEKAITEGHSSGLLSGVLTSNSSMRQSPQRQRGSQGKMLMHLWEAIPPTDGRGPLDSPGARDWG